MTPYSTRPLPPVTLLLAGCAAFLLSVGALFGLVPLPSALGLAGPVAAFPTLLASVLGRFLLVASVVLVVLASVRKLDQR